MNSRRWFQCHLPKANPIGTADVSDLWEPAVGSVRTFNIFGQRHQDDLCLEFTRYYNETRSHMECGHLSPLAAVPEEVHALNPNEIQVREYVGGLVKSFERKAV